MKRFSMEARATTSSAHHHANLNAAIAADMSESSGPPDATAAAFDVRFPTASNGATPHART